MRKMARIGLLVTLSWAAAVGCGSGDDPDAMSTSGQDASTGQDTSTSTPVAPGTEFVGIEDVVGATDSDLTLVTDPLPLEGATGSCGPTTVTPRVEEHPTEVLVYVDYAGPARSPFDGCEVAARTFTVPIDGPVGERVVSDPMGARFWLRDGAWVGCGHVVMTCITTPASCDNLRDFVTNADVPRHFGMGDTRCDGRWAVADVDYGAGDCPVTGDAQDNPCAGLRIRRMYWQVVDEAWVAVGSDPGPGCGDIAAAAPEFPVALCADLPAIPSGD